MAALSCGRTTWRLKEPPHLVCSGGPYFVEKKDTPSSRLSKNCLTYINFIDLLVFFPFFWYFRMDGKKDNKRPKRGNNPKQDNEGKQDEEQQYDLASEMPEANPLPSAASTSPELIALQAR